MKALCLKPKLHRSIELPCALLYSLLPSLEDPLFLLEDWYSDIIYNSLKHKSNLKTC